MGTDCVTFHSMKVFEKYIYPNTLPLLDNQTMTPYPYWYE